MLTSRVGFVVCTCPAFAVTLFGVPRWWGTSVLAVLVTAIGTSNVPTLVEMFPTASRWRPGTT